jgi:hypothetical protein
VGRSSLKVEKALSTTALRKTNIIDVTYRNADPAFAVVLLRDLGERYLATHLLAHSAPGTGKVFGQQVETFGDKLTRERAAITAFHKKKQLFPMPQQQSALVERLEGASVPSGETDSCSGDPYRHPGLLARSHRLGLRGDSLLSLPWHGDQREAKLS